MKKVFTIDEVAKICKVEPRTVLKWSVSAGLRGYRTESQELRIPRENLIQFLNEHGIPLGDLEEGAPKRVLIVVRDQEFIQRIKKLLTANGFAVACAASGFEAGIIADSFNPHCVVVDVALDKNPECALQIVRRLKHDHEYIPIIGILTSSVTPDTAIFAWSTEKEFDHENLVEQVRRLTEEKELE